MRMCNRNQVPTNPIRKLRFERDEIPAADFARMLGVRVHVLSGLESGRSAYLHEKFRGAFEAIGVDFDELRRAYARWRDAKHAVDGTRPTSTAEDEAAILRVIEEGFRGERAIARESGVPPSLVRKFMQDGKLA